MSNTVKAILIVLVVIGTIISAAVMYGVGEYNKAVAMDEQVKSQWAQVENQLKRRYDLIPNLVETVKGYAKHEKELFENIANAQDEIFPGELSAGQDPGSKPARGTSFTPSRSSARPTPSSRRTRTS